MSDAINPLINEDSPLFKQQWVAFLYLATKEDVDRAAAGYFGPRKKGNHFKVEFGIDMYEFLNHYIEVDLATAPIGPFIRGRVRPIISVRELRPKTDEFPGKFRAHIFNYPNGFCNEDMGVAWIPKDDWVALIGGSA